MELRQLRYFIAVAENLSFSRAAQQLHLTVPPLSRQIRQLEDEFGVPLFVRDRKHVALTDAGRLLLREAKALISQTAHISDRVRQANNGEAGLVKIGLGMGLGEPISPALVEHSSQFPAVDLQYRDMFSSLQNEALTNGDIDVGFLRPFVDTTHLLSEVLFEEGFVVHMSKANPLAKRKALRITDLTGETLLLPNRSASTFLYDKTLELYAVAGITPAVTHVPIDPVPHSDLQIALLNCQKGIFIMPDERGCRPSATSGVIAVPLDEPGAKIEVSVAWRKNEKSNAVFAFLDTVRRVFRTAEKAFPAAVDKVPIRDLKFDAAAKFSRRGRGDIAVERAND
jgi:DNA-binding transcriptional LysR family regulator